MTAHTPLAHDVRIAAEIVARIRDSGLADDDEDFASIVETETEDTLDRLRRMLRAARWAEKQAAAVKEMEADLKDRRARFEAKAEQIRSIVQWALAEIGVDKLTAPDFTASVRETPPSVVVNDLSLIPDEYVRVTRAPDKTALKEALKAGAVIPGADLGNGGSSLTVRFK